VAGIRAVLAPYPELALVAAAPTVSGLLATATDLDLAILDLRLPDGSSPAANVADLAAGGIDNVLVFTSGEEPYLVRTAAKAGVLGVVRKSEHDSVLVAAVRQAAEGGVVGTMDWAMAIDGDAEFADVALSPRQREVLALYASGESAQRVASLSGLSPDTVNDYLSRIRQKYAASGRPAPTKTELYQRALEDGWLPFPRRRRNR
jgi:DNA-binding NarL/FixJ family response regulator